MDPLSEIREKIRRIANGNGSFTCFTAKVTSVDGDTCDVELEDMKLTDVRLRAVVNGEDSKILVTPKTGSHVLVVDLSGNLSQLVVVGYSEVKKIEINVTDKIIFNGGNNHGLVKIEALKSRLNNIEQDINNLKTVISGWSPVSQDGGAALRLALSTWFVNMLQLTQRSDMEDTNITH